MVPMRDHARKPFVEGATFLSPANREEMLLLEVTKVQSAEKPCFFHIRPSEARQWVPRTINAPINAYQTVDDPGSEALS
jgi:hypothetical protein